MSFPPYFVGWHCWLKLSHSFNGESRRRICVVIGDLVVAFNVLAPKLWEVVGAFWIIFLSFYECRLSVGIPWGGGRTQTLPYAKEFIWTYFITLKCHGPLTPTSHLMKISLPNIYHPQRSCSKVMFLHLSVILFRGGLPPPPGRHPLGRHHPGLTSPGQALLLVDTPTPIPHHPWAYPPPGQTPPPTPWADTPLGRHPTGQTAPCTLHAGIRSTSGRYASYWNAILWIVNLLWCRRFLPL